MRAIDFGIRTPAPAAPGSTGHPPHRPPDDDLEPRDSATSTPGESTTRYRESERRCGARSRAARTAGRSRTRAKRGRLRGRTSNVPPPR
mmetsp:Transcript_3427/g.6604  ORF Transcript_3427/g.6604 Transcript_3427/m.6604 type:complete len:89 (+) Transcript_3427:922-1188(+)